MKVLSNGRIVFASVYEFMSYALVNLVYGVPKTSNKLAEEILAFVYLNDGDDAEYARHVHYLEKLWENRNDLLEVLQLPNVRDIYEKDGDIWFEYKDPSPYLIGKLAQHDVEGALEYLANEGGYEYMGEDEDGHMCVGELSDTDWDVWDYGGDDDDDNMVEPSNDEEGMSPSEAVELDSEFDKGLIEGGDEDVQGD